METCKQFPLATILSRDMFRMLCGFLPLITLSLPTPLGFVAMTMTLSLGSGGHASAASPMLNPKMTTHEGKSYLFYLTTCVCVCVCVCV